MNAHNRKHRHANHEGSHDSVCQLCSGDARLATHWKEPYSIYHCADCQLLFVSPIPSPEELSQFYQGFLYRKPDLKRITQLAVEKEAELKRYFGEAIMKGATFLDYGAGTGVATKAAINLECETHFYEIDHKAHEFVREHIAVDLNKMYCDVADIPTQYFDMLFCDNVIEHVRDPLAFLIELLGYLKPNGMLVVKTPNARNTELLFFPQVSVWGYGVRAWKFSGKIKQLGSVWKNRIWNCDPPRHLFSFSKKSLGVLCDKASISEYRFSYYHLPTFEYLMLRKLIRRRRPTGLSWFFEVPVAILELLIKPIYLLARKFGLLSLAGICLIARKPDN